MFVYCASFALAEISEERFEHGIRSLVGQNVFNGWVYVVLLEMLS